MLFWAFFAKTLFHEESASGHYVTQIEQVQRAALFPGTKISWNH